MDLLGIINKEKHINAVEKITYTTAENKTNA
jgi:hypothetical protein